ncbi:MAG: TolC family protein [Sulfuriferula sp.]|nr:TolC family protein [Sulfuriferula sp.]
MRRYWVAITLLGLSGVCLADSPTLTLAAALAAADQSHPDVAAAEADVAGAKADVTAASAGQDLTVTVEGVLRRGRPTLGNNDWSPDNIGHVVARKTLYDFSRTSTAVDAADAELAAREQALIGSLDQHRLDVMARYFDVLMADQQYAADNEFMAVAYVSFDNARDRYKVGQISRPDLAVLEAKYQDIREKRNASLARQRLTRSALANAMNRPGDLVSDLEDPALPDNDVKLPEYDALVPVMLAHNPALLAQRQLLIAEQKRLDSLRHETSPTLNAEFEAGDYSRDATTRNSVSGALVMTWPIYQGRRVDARIAREQAQFDKLQAAQAGLKMSLTQALLQTMLEIDQLRNSARPAAKEQSSYRDIALDRSRAEYELELKTTLGDSMAQTMVAQQRARSVEYRLALAVARLSALTGEPVTELGKLAAAK